MRSPPPPPLPVRFPPPLPPGPPPPPPSLPCPRSSTSLVGVQKWPAVPLLVRSLQVFCGPPAAVEASKLQAAAVPVVALAERAHAPSFQGRLDALLRQLQTAAGALPSPDTAPPTTLCTTVTVGADACNAMETVGNAEQSALEADGQVNLLRPEAAPPTQVESSFAGRWGGGV